MNYRSFRELAHDLLTWELPTDLDVIVGIPRSGLLAANILALNRHVHLATVEGLLRGELIQGGPRLPHAPGDFFRQPRKVLVLDDSLLTGNQMTRVRERIAPLASRHSVVFAAVYVQPGHERLVDFFRVLLPTPRIFAWNFMHHKILAQSCVDIDGVLCRAPSESENDDGLEYAKFITTVQPWCVPSIRIKYLVTCRLERFRRLTEEWLSRHRIAYDRLVMMDFPTKAARVASGSHATFKASVYRRTDTQLFVESSPEQAVDIARLSGGNVLCTNTMEFVLPPVIRGHIRRQMRPLRLLRENPGEFVRKLKARVGYSQANAR